MDGKSFKLSKNLYTVYNKSCVPPMSQMSLQLINVSRVFMFTIGPNKDWCLVEEREGFMGSDIKIYRKNR